MMSIFKKIGDMVTPHKKHAYLFNEGSWEDRQLLGNTTLTMIIRLS